ncbi:hypothetical protein IMZ11_01915 [Microtetraspora sp. AC03309]|uniref:hypothetical protein n=1 Tax=Microtetraspora sp. AC03309 TaxID=2779376 RepID=UPI001E409F56|nr:hypothetical protein [Microtetraspora sp. AC03309]MCC5574395.1 hypothetical protein [Microtetraspora sp. AC03309]
MFDEIVARYDAMLERLCLGTFAYTVTIPDSGVLTIEDVMRRLGATPAAVRGPGGPPDSDRLSLYQVGSGVVTLDWYPVERQEITDRLAGDGFRHWYLSFDIEGNTIMYARYGEVEGCLEHPEPGYIPFTPWTDRFGPLSPYTEFLVSGYDSEEAEAQVDITAACLAVIDMESGVCLDEELMDGPHSVVSISMENRPA